MALRETWRLHYEQSAGAPCTRHFLGETVAGHLLLGNRIKPIRDPRAGSSWTGRQSIRQTASCHPWHRPAFQDCSPAYHHGVRVPTISDECARIQALPVAYSVVDWLSITASPLPHPSQADCHAMGECDDLRWSDNNCDVCVVRAIPRWSAASEDTFGISPARDKRTLPHYDYVYNTLQFRIWECIGSHYEVVT